jgi:hypothetical protein
LATVALTPRVSSVNYQYYEFQNAYGISAADFDSAMGNAPAPAGAGNKTLLLRHPFNDR